jgi:truncated hemoglobin YjbI
MSTLTRSRKHLHVDELPFKLMFQALGSPSVRKLSVRVFVELAAEFVELAANKVAAPSPYLSGEITKTVEGLMLCTQQDSDLKHLARYLEAIQVADGLVAALRAGEADEVAALSHRAREYLQGSDRERFIACLDAAVGRAELSPDERVEVYERLNCLVASVPALAQVADGLVAALRAGEADEVAVLLRRAREYLQGSDRERFIACLDAAVGRAELSPDERVEVYERLNCLVASVPALAQVADGLVAALRAGKANEVAVLLRRAREYLQGSDRERFIACLDAAVGRAELSPDERVEVYERLNCLVASVPALAQVADGLVAALRAGKADEVAALSRRAREYLQGSDRERFIACLDAAVGRAELSPDERVEVYERLNCLVASVPALAQVADGLVAALRAGKADEVAALSRRAREYLQGSDRERFIACLDAAVGRAELSPDERVEVYERLNCLVASVPALAQVADGLVAALRAGKANEVAALSRRAREYLQGSDRERFIACLDAAVGRAELSPDERVEVYERLNCLVASVPALAQVADGLVAALRAGKADEVAALSRRAREYLQGSDRERFIACLDAAVGRAELSLDERAQVDQHLNSLVREPLRQTNHKARG